MPENRNLPLLAYAESPNNDLLLDGRVPLRFDDVDSVGDCQV